MPTSLIATLLVAAIAVFWALGAYNRLVRLKNAIANAFALLDVPLRRRHELTAALVEAASPCLGAQRDSLESVQAACQQARVAAAVLRGRPASAAAAAALGMAEQVLGSSLQQLYARLRGAVTGTELQADTALGQALEGLNHAESAISFARQAYNDAVADFNAAVEQFPAVLLARLFGLVPAGSLPSAAAVW